MAIITRQDLINCVAFKSAADELMDRINMLPILTDELKHTMHGGEPRYIAMYGKERVQTSGAPDPLGEIDQLLVELRAEYYVEYHKYLRHIKYVNRAISELDGVEEVRVLRLRYIDGLLWGAVAEKMHYSLRRCYEIHNSALKNMGIE